MIINQSNCSESCFRMSGTLEDIKKEVIKMIDIWIAEQVDDGDTHYYKTRQSELSDLKVAIKNIKDLSEFELMDFDFTTNYETYFKRDGDGLLVGTCNNHDWCELSVEHLESERYYDIKRGSEYRIAFEDKKYILAQKRDYEDDDDCGDEGNLNNRVKILDTICIDKKNNIELDTEEETDYDENVKYKTFKMFNTKGDYFIKDKSNSLIRINEVTDKEIVEQLQTLVSLGMGAGVKQ